MTTLAWMRRWILAVLVLGLVSTGIDLLLMQHYGSALQLVPLAAIGLALAVLAWHAVTRNGTSIRVLRATMALFVVAGVAGAGLHFRGGAQFQLEVDPSQSRWQIFRKVMQGQTPPVLASGMIVQLGLLGLLYAYRHPAAEPPDTPSS
jgi:NO-binding membrane sensor protein with MHYT domain